jgi:hypothetical protein
MSERYWNSERQEWVYPSEIITIDSDRLRAILEQTWNQGFDEGTYTEIDGIRDIDKVRYEYLSETMKELQQ